ncbi:S-layer homology domain-containing protein [Aminipila sp.]|uniref:S-layer homology domain-containing protein n=1 Tax=Aminipila sp. TaxID=2060095 RepID=UPI002899CFBF|nr:S-layer homology domain-containing protein [Aminipila sp.]
MKKVLSFVLILALVLSSFSMAFAGSATELKSLSDIGGNTNEEAIEVNYDLGIVTGNPDGTFQPAKAVTRAEFAAMITRALAIPQSALAGYANATFKDTNGYAWAVPYLAFCNSKGIMLGDGAGNAMPGKTITVNEAVTMALRAIGYTANSSELTGVWPSNYVTKAQELKMYDDVAKDAAGVDKANAAQIIYNTLTVQKVAVNSDGKTEKLWADNHKDDKGNLDNATTLLTAGLNCTAEGPVVVGGNSSSIDDSLINIAKHIGKHGTIYRNDDKEIVAFISKDNDQIVGRFTAKDKFVTTNEEKEYNINCTSAGALMLNNAKTNSTKAEFATKAPDGTVFGMDGTEFALNVDLSGKTIKEIYSAVQWKANQSKQIDAGDLNDIKDTKTPRLLGEKFILDDNDKIDYTQFDLVGVKSLSDIKADNVVYVYSDSKGIRKVEVGTQTVEGTIDSFKNAKSDAATKFAIGANTYKNAEQVVNGVSGGSSVEDKNVADDVKAFLDARGYVYDFTKGKGNKNFAVIEKQDANIDNQVKMMLADGTEKVFNYDKADDKAGKLYAGTIIGYGLNKDGKITDSNRKFITAEKINLASKTVVNSITNAKLNAQGTSVPTSAASVTTLFKNAKIDKDAVVFTYKTKSTTNVADLDKETRTPNGSPLITSPTDASIKYYNYIDDYDVTTLDKVDVDKDIAGDGVYLLFDENNNGSLKEDKIVAMFIPDSAAKSGTKSYAVINEKTRGTNADKDKVWKITGIIDNQVKTDVLTDDGGDSFFDGYSAPVYKKGLTGLALYQVKVDAKGVITDATRFKPGTVDFDNDKKLKSTDVMTVEKADKKNSVLVRDKDASGNVLTSSTRYAISDKAFIYELNSDDDYVKSSSDLHDGDQVVLYETNDDEDGYDIVVFVRAGFDK